MDAIIYSQCHSVMVETLKTCDVLESNYSGGNGLRDRNVVCDVTSMLSGEQMYCEINVINGTDALIRKRYQGSVCM